MDYDLRIVGGVIVDGSGRDRYRGDVGIRDGRVVALGDAPGEARETFDAAGAVVAPGFVDIHTHYDAQILWDRTLACSPWHGVTTAVIGNCGFGVAPMRPPHREVILRTLEKVEGMSYEGMRAGLGSDWPFETYGEYLGVLSAEAPAINVAPYLGHTPLRLYVMGLDAFEREARPDELEAMKRIVREAMALGAFGFSTSQAATHHGFGGKPVPSRLASFGEVDALVAAMRESGRGTFQVAVGRGLFNDEMEDLATRHGVPITWTALLAGMAGPGSHRRHLAAAAAQKDKGLVIVPQVACRPILFDFHLEEPYPFEILPSFHEVMRQDREGKLRAYRDESFRARFRADSGPEQKHVNAGWAERAVISRHDPDPLLEERSVADVARERGVHPVDLVLDLSLETALSSRFRFAFLNHAEDEVRELITNPDTVITLSDAGAHADQLCDAGFATHLLGYWVRERGALGLEAAVHALTQRPAELVGLRDRGLLALGRPADVVVFDPARVGGSKLRRVADGPGGTERLVSDALGVHAVVVNGRTLRAHGEDRLGARDALPGALLRAGASA